MKILSIFIDMLGADYMNISNAKCPPNAMDNFLCELGGTFYSNCFSPAPDTPRSAACMWSGRYPRKNGCDNRLKYPGYFLKCNNIWDKLKNKGYSFNLFMDIGSKLIRLLPEQYETIANTGTLKDFADSCVIEDDSCTFIYLQDLHMILDEYGYTKDNFYRGTKFCEKLLKGFFSMQDINLFDYIIIYSDHGFRLEGSDKEYLLDSDRLRTVMFVHKKGDSVLIKDEYLRSNMDYYPTLCDIAGLNIEHDIDGKSLFSNGHDFVMVEDHKSFTVTLNQTMEYWAYITSDGKIHNIDASGEWDKKTKKEYTSFEIQRMEERISGRMSNYDVNHKTYMILHQYDNNKVELRYFSDGTPVSDGTRIFDLDKDTAGGGLFVWGCGPNGLAACSYYSGLGYNVLGFIDNDISKQNKSIMGKRVYAPSILDKYDHSKIEIILSMRFGYEEEYELKLKNGNFKSVLHYEVSMNTMN